jgi:dTDP-4-dehydrorhamnose 3,5-epimerase
MQIEERKLKGTFEITLNRIGDSRGYFMRTYDKTLFEEKGLQTVWQQENQSYSTRLYTVRGLHFQYPPFAETKLVRAVQGAILDVFVDLRTGSATYGQWDSIELSEDNGKLIYIPRGFAHGFCTLTEHTLVQYKVDNSYAPSQEGGIRWNDPTIGVDWKIDETTAFLSDRDQKSPFFADFDSPFKS